MAATKPEELRFISALDGEMLEDKFAIDTLGIDSKEINFKHLLENEGKLKEEPKKLPDDASETDRKQYNEAVKAAKTGLQNANAKAILEIFTNSVKKGPQAAKDKAAALVKLAKQAKETKATAEDIHAFNLEMVKFLGILNSIKAEIPGINDFADPQVQFLFETLVGYVNNFRQGVLGAEVKSDDATVETKVEKDKRLSSLGRTLCEIITNEAAGASKGFFSSLFGGEKKEILAEKMASYSVGKPVLAEVANGDIEPVDHFEALNHNLELLRENMKKIFRYNTVTASPAKGDAFLEKRAQAFLASKNKVSVKGESPNDLNAQVKGLYSALVVLKLLSGKEEFDATLNFYFDECETYLTLLNANESKPTADSASKLKFGRNRFLRQIANDENLDARIKEHNARRAAERAKNYAELKVIVDNLDALLTDAKTKQEKATGFATQAGDAYKKAIALPKPTAEMKALIGDKNSKAEADCIFVHSANAITANNRIGTSVGELKKAIEAAKSASTVWKDGQPLSSIVEQVNRANTLAQSIADDFAIVEPAAARAASLLEQVNALAKATPASATDTAGSGKKANEGKSGNDKPATETKDEVKVEADADKPGDVPKSGKKDEKTKKDAPKDSGTANGEPGDGEDPFAEPKTDIDAKTNKDSKPPKKVGFDASASDKTKPGKTGKKSGKVKPEVDNEKLDLGHRSSAADRTPSAETNELGYDAGADRAMIEALLGQMDENPEDHTDAERSAEADKGLSGKSDKDTTAKSKKKPFTFSSLFGSSKPNQAETKLENDADNANADIAVAEGAEGVVEGDYSTDLDSDSLNRELDRQSALNRAYREQNQRQLDDSRKADKQAQGQRKESKLLDDNDKLYDNDSAERQAQDRRRAERDQDQGRDSERSALAAERQQRSRAEGRKQGQRESKQQSDVGMDDQRARRDTKRRVEDKTRLRLSDQSEQSDLRATNDRSAPQSRLLAVDSGKAAQPKSKARPVARPASGSQTLQHMPWTPDGGEEDAAPTRRPGTARRPDQKASKDLGARASAVQLSGDKPKAQATQEQGLLPRMPWTPGATAQATQAQQQRASTAQPAARRQGAQGQEQVNYADNDGRGLYDALMGRKKQPKGK